MLISHIALIRCRRSSGDASPRAPRKFDAERAAEAHDVAGHQRARADVLSKPVNAVADSQQWLQRPPRIVAPWLTPYVERDLRRLKCYVLKPVDIFRANSGTIIKTR